MKDILLGSQRPAVVSALTNVAHSVIESTGGITGMALKGGLKAATAVRDDIDTLLPDLAAALEPYWNTYSAGGFAGSFGAYLAENSSSVTADLAAIADGYVEGHDIGALKKLYTSARNKGLEVLGKHLGELGDTLEKFA